VAYRIVIEKRARKAFAALPEVMRQRTGSAVDALATNPRPGGAKALAGGMGLLRIRVGDYRIVHRVNDDAREVRIIDIGHRREVYRGL
jgi:mRNA interferase RelE/StbE